MNELLNYPDAVFPVSVVTKELLLLIHSAFTRLAVRQTRSVSTFNILSVLLIKDQVFRDMTLCGLVNIYRRLRGNCSLHLQPEDRCCKVLRVLANIYRSIRLHIS